MEYVKKRGARLFVATGQPQGGGGFKGGENNSRGGRMPPLNTPLAVQNILQLAK